MEIIIDSSKHVEIFLLDEKTVLEDMDKQNKAKKAAILVPKRAITSPMSIA